MRVTNVLKTNKVTEEVNSKQDVYKRKSSVNNERAPEQKTRRLYEDHRQAE